MKKLILASSSDDRIKMLNDAGFVFQAIPHGVDERSCQSVSPRNHACTLSNWKAVAISKQYPNAVVIGSDQVFALPHYTGTRILHKVDNHSEATERLKIINGKFHNYHSAVSIAINGDLKWWFIGETTVKLNDLTNNIIKKYLKKVGAEVYRDNPGCYRIDNDHVDTIVEYYDHDNDDIMMGMPMEALTEKLMAIGIMPEK